MRNPERTTREKSSAPQAGAVSTTSQMLHQVSVTITALNADLLTRKINRDPPNFASIPAPIHLQARFRSLVQQGDTSRAPVLYAGGGPDLGEGPSHWMIPE